MDRVRYCAWRRGYPPLLPLPPSERCSQKLNIENLSNLSLVLVEHLLMVHTTLGCDWRSPGSVFQHRPRHL